MGELESGECLQARENKQGGRDTYQVTLSGATREDVLVGATRAKPVPATDGMRCGWCSCIMRGGTCHSPARLQLEPLVCQPLLGKCLQADRTGVRVFYVL